MLHNFPHCGFEMMKCFFYSLMKKKEPTYFHRLLLCVQLIKLSISTRIYLVRKNKRKIVSTILCNFKFNMKRRSKPVYCVKVSMIHGLQTARRKQFNVMSLLITLHHEFGKQIISRIQIQRTVFFQIERKMIALTISIWFMNET